MKKNRNKIEIQSKKWAAYAAAGAAAALGGTQSVEADITVVELGVQLLDNTPGTPNNQNWGYPHSQTFGASRVNFRFIQASDSPGVFVTGVWPVVAGSAPASG